MNPGSTPQPKIDWRFVVQIEGYFAFLKTKPNITIPIGEVEMVQFAPGVLAIIYKSGDIKGLIDVLTDPTRWRTLPPFDSPRVSVQYAREYGIDVLMASAFRPMLRNLNDALSEAKRYLVSTTQNDGMWHETPVPVPRIETQRIRNILPKKGYEPDPCTECGYFTVKCNGCCLRCDTCGTSTGCN